VNVFCRFQANGRIENIQTRVRHPLTDGWIEYNKIDQKEIAGQINAKHSKLDMMGRLWKDLNMNKR